MITLFFLLSLFFAWLAWNLYHPIFTNPRLAMLSWLAGWLTGEMALHIIFWQVILVAFFVLVGAVAGFFGAISFLLCIGAWATMAFYYHESFQAEAEVANALQSGLGEHFESEINEEFRHHFSDKPDKNLIRHPFRHRDPQVTLIRNVRFGDKGQSLDIRHNLTADPADNSRPRPVLLQIHGGGWTYGKKDDGQAVPLMNNMAKQGWVCVATSYRLSPAATFPDHIIDCKQALAWIREHIHEYGGDPDFVAVTGGSAGGHLSSLLALSANHPPFQPGFENIDTSVQVAVPFYGVYDLADEHGLHHHKGTIRFLENSILKMNLVGNENTFREASPYFQVHEKAPPMMVIHGAFDTLVPVATARVFVEELRRVSQNKVVYLECAKTQHAFDVIPSPRSEYVKFGVEKFLTWAYSQYLKSD